METRSPTGARRTMKERRDSVERIVDGCLAMLPYVTNDEEPDDVALKRLRRLEQRVKQFEEASGVDIRRCWTGGQVGAAVKFVMEGGLESEKRRLEELIDRHREVIALIETAVTQAG